MLQRQTRTKSFVYKTNINKQLCLQNQHKQTDMNSLVYKSHINKELRLHKIHNFLTTVGLLCHKQREKTKAASFLALFNINKQIQRTSFTNVT